VERNIKVDLSRKNITLIQNQNIDLLNQQLTFLNLTKKERKLKHLKFTIIH